MVSRITENWSKMGNNQITNALIKNTRFGSRSKRNGKNMCFLRNWYESYIYNKQRPGKETGSGKNGDEEWGIIRPGRKGEN